MSDRPGSSSGKGGNRMSVLHPVEIGSYIVGPKHPMLWILGPCVIESRELTLAVAHRLAEIGKQYSIPVVFKASFDKANRTSGGSFRGLGMEAGLEVLAEVKRVTKLPVTTDVHEREQVAEVAKVVDLL